MDTTAILQRLRARLTNVREIESAAGLDAAMRGNLVAPAVYVIPLAERGTLIEDTGPVSQVEDRMFGVIQVVETLHTLGAPGVVDLAAVRAQVKSALIGWVPDDETGEPVVFVGGELVDFAGNGQLWWSDEFTLTGYFRSTP